MAWISSVYSKRSYATAGHSYPIIHHVPMKFQKLIRCSANFTVSTSNQKMAVQVAWPLWFTLSHSSCYLTRYYYDLKHSRWILHRCIKKVHRILICTRFSLLIVEFVALHLSNLSTEFINNLYATMQLGTFSVVSFIYFVINPSFKIHKYRHGSNFDVNWTFNILSRRESQVIRT